MPAALIGLAALLLVLAAADGLLRPRGISPIPAYIILGLLTQGAAVSYEVIHFVEVIGVALLLFFVGLEFSILRLRRQARRLAAAGAADFAINFPVGFVGGLALGWNVGAAFLLGAALYISSSAIVAANVSSLRRAAYPETEVALGILVAEDLIIAIVLAAVSIWMPLPGAAPPWVAGLGIVGLVAVLTVLEPPIARALGWMGDRLDDEALLLAISGILLAFTGLAMAAGLSEAIGAFAAGLLVGDCRFKPRVEELLGSFQGLFSALFFFAFGLRIDAGQLGGVWLPGLLLAGGAALSKLVGSLWIGRMTGLSLACRLNLGFTLVPRGEFSVLLAAYGAAAGHGDLPALVAVVVVVLSVVGTLFTQVGPRLATSIARRLQPAAA